MDKVAAASFLGISLRTLERYIRDGKIAFQRVDGRPEFSEEELSRFKDESKAPIHVPRRDKSLDLVPRDAFMFVNEPVEAIAHYYRQSSLQTKLILTLVEAEEVSGLSRSFLLSKIRSKDLTAKKFGRSWKIRLMDLHFFINEEFVDKKLARMEKRNNPQNLRNWQDGLPDNQNEGLTENF